MPTKAFISLTAGLRDLGGGRVWSLMISLFGDLARDPGTVIDGPILSDIMRGLQVKPEAARVALHRLRNDGWIESRKSGRISQHMLSEKGQSESAKASPRIYADPDALPGGWQLVLAPDGELAEQIEQKGFAQVMPRVLVGPRAAKVPAPAVAFEGGSVPPWLADAAQPENLRQSYEDLLAELSQLDRALEDCGDLSATETAILRCLIVHNWRRLVLKHPLLPAPLVSADWPGHRCHLLVHKLLTDHPRPGLKAIAQSRAAA